MFFYLINLLQLLIYPNLENGEIRAFMKPSRLNMQSTIFNHLKIAEIHTICCSERMSWRTIGTAVLLN